DKTTFSEKLNNLSDVQLVDVRTPEEFANGAIENAVNINFYDESFGEAIAKLDKSKPIMVYCQAGTEGGRSGQTLDKLKELGFEEIYELAGGYGGWSKE
ncbi:MAG: rhodanese-like domain-containing protein, partial [Bacteroidota bacterium]